MKPPMLTIQQCADRLTCHHARIRRLIGAGKLRAVRVGASWRIEPEALDEFIARNSTVVAEPAHPEADGLPEAATKRFM